MSHTPRGLKAKLWAQATAAQGVRVRCHFCPAWMAYAEATVDHEPPLALSGHPRRDVVLACDPCNQRRAKQTNDIVNHTQAAGGKPRGGRKKGRR